MSPKLINAEYIKDYKILVTFSDGTSGIIDLENELWGEVFEPLKDISEFQKFKIDPELKTLVWPTGADLAPEFLHEQASA
jgi:hypothetical protein